ncbi:hypothetical protein ACIP3D_31150 [Streptomyces longwoodensis]|uniref:hypothetical protein n=1 Tax=Streptomyces longwoodensis TaxID=68231 RepID=UPI003827F1B9
MDIPGWFVWIYLGAILFQVLALGPAVGRLRGPDASLRIKARWDLLEITGTILLFGGLLLGLEVAEAWSWLSVAGFALLTPVYAVQGTRRLRTRRRRPTARAERQA